jgi:RNA polymerase sigma-70 factor (ECF subfamily)
MSGYSGNDEQVTELALAAGAGDQVAVAGFIRLTQRDVIRFVGHLAGPAEADDLAQETFLRAMKALPGFEGRSSARTWLLSIARNTVLDHLRSQSRRPRLAALTDWASVADAAQSGEGPRFDEQILLEQLIARLTPERREAFVATQLLGLSYQDAADVVGCPVGTIRSRVARAREDLASALTTADVPKHPRLRAI